MEKRGRKFKLFMNSDIFILLGMSFHMCLSFFLQLQVFIFILYVGAYLAYLSPCNYKSPYLHFVLIRFVGAYLSSCESFNYQSSFYPQLSIFILAMIKCRDSFTYLSVLFEHANMVSLLNDETFFH